MASQMSLRQFDGQVKNRAVVYSATILSWHMRTVSYAFYAVLISAILNKPASSADAINEGRREFAGKLARIQDSMDKADVIELLGPPDQIRYPGTFDHFKLGTPKSKQKKSEMLCYGTGPDKDAFPTLGRVYLDNEGRVIDWCGSCVDSEFAGESISETTVRNALHKIYECRVGVFHYAEYDPRRVLKAASVLQRFGRNNALNILLEYYHVSGDFERERDIIPCLLRLLFEPANGASFCSLLDRPRADAVSLANLRNCPQYPVVLISSVPLFLESRRLPCSTSNGREILLEIKVARDSCNYRDMPFCPPDHPDRLLDDALEWYRENFPPNARSASFDKWAEESFIIQISYLCSDIPGVELDQVLKANSLDDYRTEWARVRKSLASRELKWSEDKCQYVIQ